MAFLIKTSLAAASLYTLAQAGAPHESPEQLAIEAKDNILYSKYILNILAAAVLCTAAYRLTIYTIRYIRMLACLNNDKQKYFLMPNANFATFKRHFLYAPLFGRRHKQEIRVGPLGFGILPSRPQSIILTGLIAMNVVLCVRGIEWHGRSDIMLNHLRNRSGTLAVVNMIPLFIMAGRNNPLIGLLNLPFDTFNLFHRWFGRIVVIEAVVHTVAFTTKLVQKAGWKGAQESLKESSVLITGLIGTCAFLAIMLQANAIFRHAFYETFLHIHIALIMLAIVALWYHLEGLQQRTYLIIVILAWALERFTRLGSLVYRNFGTSRTRAHVEAMAGDALRITISPARPWRFFPGQHAFITIPSVGLWTSHPFSLAWSNAERHPSLDDFEKGLPENRHADETHLPLGRASVSFVVRRRAGFTEKLYQKALHGPSSQVTLNALVEGPYGGLHSLQSYGTVLLFAGGVGITHQVPYIRSLVAGFASGTVAARRVSLVWVIQSPEHLEWIRPWMTEILSMEKRRDVLRIQLFVTRPRSTKEIHSPSATVQMYPGKPNVNTLIEMEMNQQIGAMAVSVCGPAGLCDDVRAAVRRRQGEGNLDFLEECFSW